MGYDTSTASNSHNTKTIEIGDGGGKTKEPVADNYARLGSREQAAARRRAKGRVQNAVRNFRAFRPAACVLCGTISDQIDGHHPDYDRPYLVAWLCPLCHRRAHSDSAVACAAAKVATEILLTAEELSLISRWTVDDYHATVAGNDLARRRLNDPKWTEYASRINARRLLSKNGGTQ